MHYHYIRMGPLPLTLSSGVTTLCPRFLSWCTKMAFPSPSPTSNGTSITSATNRWFSSDCARDTPLPPDAQDDAAVGEVLDALCGAAAEDEAASPLPDAPPDEAIEPSPAAAAAAAANALTW